jgi:hypothetical protein
MATMELKTIIEEYARLLPIGTSVSYTEAEKRAGEFLVAMAKITDLKHTFSNEKIRLQSIQTAVFAQEIAKGDGKTITKDKLVAEASEAYQVAREDLEMVDNDISYLRAYYDIMNNAHIFYRALSRESK